VEKVSEKFENISKASHSHVSWKNIHTKQHNKVIISITKLLRSKKVDYPIVEVEVIQLMKGPGCGWLNELGRWI